ncbi:hypothetical protein ACA910_016828 [Epithemia clementina (nom. ined.)]
MARYTCPRCEIPYCSLDCYRVHNKRRGAASTTLPTTGEDLSKSLIGGDCTESFYQDRVASVTNLEAKAHAEQTRRMIQRIYNNQQQQIDHDLSCEQQPTPEPESSDLSQEQLIAILRILEYGQKTPEELHRLVTSISPRFQKSLKQAILKGHVQEWVIEPWHPWWKPELADLELLSDELNDDNFENDNSNQYDNNNGGKTLDDRLVEEVPSFSELRPKKKTGNNDPQHDRTLLESQSDMVVVDLRYNLVDVLYAVVSVLRLFYGVTNASCRDNCLEAAETLIQSSPVLSKDARWMHLEQVLTTIICSASTQSSLSRPTCDYYAKDNNENDAMPNNIKHDLLGDVALILRGNFRLVARALLEGMDILQCAILSLTATKQNDQRNRDDDDDGGEVDQRLKGINSSSRKKAANQMKRIRKKMEYFLSWAKYHDEQNQMQKQYLLEGNSFASLADSIEVWLGDWNAEKDLSS